MREFPPLHPLLLIGFFLLLFIVKLGDAAGFGNKVASSSESNPPVFQYLRQSRIPEEILHNIVSLIVEIRIPTPDFVQHDIRVFSRRGLVPKRRAKNHSFPEHGPHMTFKLRQRSSQETNAADLNISIGILPCRWVAASKVAVGGDREEQDLLHQ